MPTPRRSGRDDALLAHLFTEVRRCREKVRSGRDPNTLSVPHQEQASRCAALADAMEAYADAAAGSGVPLPYRYRDEMRLYRAMATGGLSSQRPPRP
ncbi:hypothetical protein G5V58_01905 [Nocardioides anomalus]|uniref:Uncharacterized protein n=1 Tax=Nocardioides anomalus TaxID=2712223 RepID=A0A6G6W8L7_9ACTN|nr:hypothetical protein [Nocardioides anomalus]QIG41691.1 hypothetical protein G5V58_01905 [Nocardioides anomalus]